MGEEASPRRDRWGMGPRSNRGAWLVVLTGILGSSHWGCASGPPRYPTSLQPPTAPRRPPGVSLDRPFATPTVQTHDERLTVLVPPLDPVLGRQVVAAFFASVQAQDTQALGKTLAQHAVQQQMGGGKGYRDARDYWQRRFARLDYRALSNVSLYRPEDVDIRHTAKSPLPFPVGEEEPWSSPGGALVLTVPLLTTHVGNTRLFGPFLSFTLVEENDQLVIARIAEEFQLP